MASKKIAIIGYGRIGKVFKKILKKEGNKILVIEKKQKNFKENVLKIKNFDFIFLCIPTKAIRSFISENKQNISEKSIIITISKGIEEKTCKLPFQIIKEILPKNKIGILGGALMAEEIKKQQKTTAYFAAEKKQTFYKINRLFKNTNLKIIFFPNPIILNLIGVLKNIYVLFITVTEYFNLNLNIKSEILSKCYLEIKKIINKLTNKNINYEEILLSDLIVTSFSPHSNNKKSALYFLKNKIKIQSESLYSLKTIIQLTKKHKLNLPILNKISLIYLKNKDAKKVFNY